MQQASGKYWLAKTKNAQVKLRVFCFIISNVS